MSWYKGCTSISVRVVRRGHFNWPEVCEWLKDNINDDLYKIERFYDEHGNGFVSFLRDEDAVLFALKWS
jgi:hypothetical protein